MIVGLGCLIFFVLHSSCVSAGTHPGYTVGNEREDVQLTEQGLYVFSHILCRIHSKVDLRLIRNNSSTKLNPARSPNFLVSVSLPSCGRGIPSSTVGLLFNKSLR